jgi:threonylcarbamoyladenosine tRNA methylthiotransferase MtaB
MNRPYSAGRFRELIEGIARRLSGIGLGTDIVVGHPGEDPSASTRTRELLRSLPLSYLHVFPFSPRPGTRAAQLEGRIPPSEAKRRCAELRVIDAEKRDSFWHSQLGRELDVLLEVPAEGRAGFWKGHTDNYLRVLVPLDAGKDGDLVRVRLVEGPMGEPLGIPPPRGASC